MPNRPRNDVFIDAAIDIVRRIAQLEFDPPDVKAACGTQRNTN